MHRHLTVLIATVFVLASPAFSQTDVDVLTHRLRHGRKLLVQVTADDMIASKDKRFIEPALDVLFAGGRDASREAARVIAGIGGEDIVPDLLPKLRAAKRSRDADRFGDVLRLIGGKSVRSAMAKLLANRQAQPVARIQAARVLLMLDDPKDARLVDKVVRKDGKSLGRGLREVLAAHATKNSVPTLMRVIGDVASNIDERDIVRALGRIGDKRAYRTLVAALQSDRLYVPAAAAEALGKLGNRGAGSALLKTLKHKDDRARIAAALALGRLKYAGAVRPLAKMLEDPDEDVRLAAAGALAMLGRARGRDFLVRAMMAERLSIRSSPAVNMLQACGDAQCQKILYDDYTTKTSPVWVRSAAAMAALGEDDALEVLHDTLLHEDNTKLMIIAGGAIARFAKPKSIDTLVAAPGNTALRYPDLQGTYRNALVAMDSPDVRKALRAGLTNKNYLIRAGSCLPLASIEKRAAIDALLPLLDDGKWYVRRAAAEALGYLPDPRVIEKLREKLAQDPSYRVRSRIPKALGMFGNEEFAADLEAALEDKHQWVRQAALESLGMLQGSAAADAMLRMLADRDGGVVMGAAKYFMKRRDKRSVTPLMTALRRLRSAEISWALGFQGDAAAVETLVWVIDNSREARDRNAAVEALGQIGSTKALPALTKALKDRSRDVRKLATKAIDKIKKAHGSLTPRRR